MLGLEHIYKLQSCSHSLNAEYGQVHQNNSRKESLCGKKKDEDHTLYEISYFKSGISSFCI